MNKLTFIKLLQNPDDISLDHIQGLEEVIKNFPYCQAAHILLAKATHQAGGMLAEQKLKKAAAYTADRKNLKRIISSHKAETVTTLPEAKPIHAPSIPTTTAIPITATAPVKENPSDILPVEEIPQNEEIKAKEDNQETIDEEGKKKVLEPIIEEKKETGFEGQTKSLLAEQKEKTVSEEFESIIPPPEKSRYLLEEAIIKELSSKPILKEPENPVNELKEAIKHFNTEGKPDDQKKRKAKPGSQDVKPEDILLHYFEYLKESKKSKVVKDKSLEKEIIDKFIKEDPAIPKLRNNNIPTEQEDLSAKSTVVSKLPASENFAKLMEKQGKIDKAIDIYKELILKYPEKKTYFATQIENLTKR